MKTRLWLGGLFWLAAAHALAVDNPYAGRSDRELTDIAADWEALSEEQRRALLTEMRGRMDATTDRGDAPVIAIRTQRRYGRLVRQPDGSVVRIEATQHVVQYRRLPRIDAAAAEQPFGVGFERRAGDAPVAEDATAPVSPVRVEQPAR